MKSRTRFVKTLVPLLAAAGLAGLGSAHASAKTGSENLAGEKAVFLKVLNAKDQKATYDSLSPADKALLGQALTHQVATEVVSTSHRMSTTEVTTAIDHGTLAASPAAAAMTASSGGCWNAYVYDSWSDFGTHDGDTWMQLNWCSNGTNVTTSYYNNTGARGVNGSEFTGIAGDWNRNVGWETRTAIEYRFNFQYINLYPCEQIRGGATGLYSHQKSCNLS